MPLRPWDRLRQDTYKDEPACDTTDQRASNHGKTLDMLWDRVLTDERPRTIAGLLVIDKWMVIW